MEIGRPTNCPDCGGALEAGTLVDYSRSGIRPSQWTEGPLHTSIWLGAVKNERRLEVTTYRCRDCGLLRLYADREASGHKYP